MSASLLWLIVGGIWGSVTVLLLMRNMQLSAKLSEATRVGNAAVETAIKAKTELEEAREIFAVNLKRPAAAFFNEEQVKSLADRLVELLFIPVSQAVKREISKKPS